MPPRKYFIDCEDLENFPLSEENQVRIFRLSFYELRGERGLFYKVSSVLRKLHEEPDLRDFCIANQISSFSYRKI